MLNCMLKRMLKCMLKRMSSFKRVSLHIRQARRWGWDTANSSRDY